MKTTIDLPPDLLRLAAHLGIDLPHVIEHLLRRHLRKISTKLEMETHANESLDWRQELL
ncbi:MAG: hypothetical protein ABI600_18350 [Luteolibacter sp.]